MKQNILRPVTVQTAPAESRPTLATIQKAFGFVPNLMATFRELPYRPARLSCDGRGLGKRDLQAPIERSVVLLAASVANS